VADDPKKKLTAWLTEGLDRTPEKGQYDRTRLVVRGQKAWYMASLSLDDPFFSKMVEVDQQLMMAYKGQRSDDVVKALSSLEQQEVSEVGLREVTDMLKARRKGP